MSPEQIEGCEVTPASDIYALVLVMYLMVTGVRPLEGETPFSTVLKRLAETPLSPRRFVPDLDSRWEATILTCLKRQPDRRFGTAQAVVDALTGEESPQATLGPAKDGCAPFVWYASHCSATSTGGWVGAVAVITITAVFFLYRPHRFHRLSENDTIVLADFVNTTGEPVFNDSLREALRAKLEQSPFLNLMPEPEFARHSVTWVIQRGTR